MPYLYDGQERPTEANSSIFHNQPTENPERETEMKMQNNIVNIEIAHEGKSILEMVRGDVQRTYD